MRSEKLFLRKGKTRIICNMLILVSVFCLALLLSGSIMEARPTYSMVHTDGKLIKNVQGETVPVYGTNIGSTLHNEHFMNRWYNNGANANNWKTTLNTLVQRFGSASTEALLTDFRTKHLTELDDIRYISSYLGATVVRLPIYYQWLEDDNNPYVYKQSGWDAIDAIVNWAETYHLYVVLHLQGVPGGQNINWNHNGGSEGILYEGITSAGLWVDLDMENSGSNIYNYTERTIALWRAIATRYRGRVGVFGYNLMNEPHAYPLDASGQEDYQLRNQFYRTLYTQIRSVDPDHILIMESFRTNNGTEQGNGWLATLPTPSVEGWTNVVYSDSMYYNYNIYMNGIPGTIVAVAPYFQQTMDAFNVPFYINQISPTKWNGGTEPYGSTSPWQYLNWILTDFNTRNWGWQVWSYKVRRTYEEWGIIDRPYVGSAEEYIDVGTQSYNELINKFNNEKTSNNYSGNPPFIDVLRLHSDPANINWGTAMHVLSIRMSFGLREVGADRYVSARATVTIFDGGGFRVAGATVAGQWSGATSDTDSGATDSAGKVTLQSDEVLNPPSGTTYTFTVTNVTKSGWTYDSAANNETSDSITVQIPPQIATYNCDGIDIKKGSLISGDHTNLHADDGSYLQIDSSGKRIDWNAYALIAQAPSSVTKLEVTYDGHYSTNRTQTLELWNYTTSAWDEIDKRGVGTTDVTVIWWTADPGVIQKYISDTGDIKLRVYVDANNDFTGYGDYVRYYIEYTP